ncbi:MAG: hypothetical protein A2144_08405 [Chloroflexi bacterium RBG_16_50_9]|nr:MAG: hypothetical protein A2144_08405 [Chloroflexi bacterium RBG_16_50_9]
MAFLETVDLWQRRDGRDLLKNINIRVERNEVFALIGPTGAGKTTLLRLIDLIDTPASGKIFFHGVDTAISDSARLEMRRRMAFVLQKPVVFNMSVFDNIACGLRWRGTGHRQIKEKVNGILETVGLAEYRNRNARTLSGGEMQRVAIARAIATEPEVLLLDEPTANLDPISSSKIEELIRQIIMRNSMTAIMATHDMAQGQRLADRISVLVNGEIVQTGGSREVFTSPRNRAVAEFVGMENLLDGVVISNEGNMLTIGVNGTIVEAVAEYAAGTAVSVGIRPEDVTLSLSKISSSARNSLTGEISLVVTAGPLSRVEIDCGFRLVALVTKRSTEEMGLEKGKRVYASFKATSIHVIKQ